jgi:hypothetical protein
MYSIVDESSIHNKNKLMRSFNLGDCFEIEHKFMPSKTVKRLNSLNNSIFHDWIGRSRHHYPLTKKNYFRDSLRTEKSYSQQTNKM